MCYRVWNLFKAPDDLERSPVLTAGKAYFGLLTYGGH